MTMSVGIIGFPIRHTVSPAFQQAAFDHHRVSARYDVWETPPDDLERRVADLRAVTMLKTVSPVDFVEVELAPLAGLVLAIEVDRALVREEYFADAVVGRRLRTSSWLGVIPLP